MQSWGAPLPSRPVRVARTVAPGEPTRWPAAGRGLPRRAPEVSAVGSQEGEDVVLSELQVIHSFLFTFDRSVDTRNCLPD
jgi:hypothetical protein